MRTLLAAALLVLVAGCGGSDGDSKAGAEKAINELPKCSSIWKLGETLPADYQGCMDGDTATALTGYDCESGEGTLYAYEDPTTGSDKFYAVTGSKVQDSSDDKAYGETYDACLGN